MPTIIVPALPNVNVEVDVVAYLSPVMFDSGGNGGAYYEGGGIWITYYNRGSNCLGINGSAASGSYSLQVNGSKGINVVGGGSSFGGTVTIAGATTIAAGGAYAIQASSSQRYIIQALNTSNSVNAGYGWWWFHNTNGDMGFHADGAADRLTLSRAGDLTVTNLIATRSYAAMAPTVYNTNWNTSFSNTPVSTMAWGGDVSAGGPTGTWWFQVNMRHSNASNDWGTQLAYGWEDNANQIYQRNVTGGNWSAWVRYLNSGNYNSYAPTLTGGGASGTWGINVTGTAGSAPNGSNINNYYDTTAGNGYGFRFWNGADNYKISMGASALYYYGPVTDYSIKTQMNDGDTGRGFTWGRISYAPIAAINSTSGNMQIAGTFTSSTQYVANGNSSITVYGPNASWGAFLYVGAGSNNNQAGVAQVISTDGNLHLDCATNTKQVYINYYSGMITGIYGSLNMQNTSISNASNITSNTYVRAGTNVYTDQNFGYGLIGLYSSYRFQGVFAMGDAYKLPVDGTTTGNLYGLAWSHPNAGGQAANLSNHGLLVVSNGVTQCALTNNIWVANNISCDLLNTGNVINIGYTRGGGDSIATSAFRGIEFHNPGGTGYYIGKPAGAWTQPLDIAFYTGIRYAANSGYVGHRWYNSTDFATETFSVNNGDNNVRVPYKLAVGTQTTTGQNLTVYSATGAGQVRIGGVAPAIYFTDILSDPANYIGLVGLATQTNNFFTGTAAGDFVMYNSVSGFNLFVVNYSGGVYLTSGATSWTANSDIRLKNINSHIENAVEKLSTLQTINFSYKDDKFKKQNLGLIAQEVEKIFPELIDKNNDGMLGVRYTELVPVLIKAIQELKLEIETLKNK